jgi:endonuclease/exonuclease/phosphatase family metal-dependent hydrolase
VDAGRRRGQRGGRRHLDGPRLSLGLHIATWNIQFGRQLRLVLDGLDELPAFDAIALQELSEHGGQPDATRIAEHLGPGWDWAQVTAQMVGGRHQANGFVWNSRRIHVNALTAIDLPTPSGRAMRRLPPSWRKAAILDGRIDGHRLRLYSVHLDVFGIAHKHAQFAEVLRDAARRPAVDLSVITGDMNTFGIGGRPRWEELRRLARVAGFKELTTGIGWTHRGLGVRQKLDAIFVSPIGMRHQTQRVVLNGSDHIPLWAELCP